MNRLLKEDNGRESRCVCVRVLWGSGDGLLVKGAFGAFYLFHYKLIKISVIVKPFVLCVYL